MAKKILIVDDEPDVLKVVCFRIKKTGYEVVSAVDGEEALKVAGAEKPDLILLDGRLPKLNGPEVCVRLKKDDSLKHIPVIIFTASIESIADKIAACGAQDYILKPFTADDLIEKIKKFVG